MQRELTSPGRRNIWIIRCSDVWKEGSLEAFIGRIRSAGLSFDMENLSYVFHDPDYGVIEAGMDRSLTIDGRAEVYKGFTPEGTVEISDI